jgi:hypothetical protein
MFDEVDVEVKSKKPFARECATIRLAPGRWGKWDKPAG